MKSIFKWIIKWVLIGLLLLTTLGVAMNWNEVCNLITNYDSLPKKTSEQKVVKKSKPVEEVTKKEEVKEELKVEEKPVESKKTDEIKVSKLTLNGESVVDVTLKNYENVVAEKIEIKIDENWKHVVEFTIDLHEGIKFSDRILNFGVNLALKFAQYVGEASTFYKDKSLWSKYQAKITINNYEHTSHKYIFSKWDGTGFVTT